MSYQALLFCPDIKTALVVTQVLQELEFTVEPCNDPFAAVKRLMAQHFDAIVVDCDNEQNATLLFKTARSSGLNQSSLAVAVVEGQAGVAKAFRIGANLVLTKPINVEQSKGTLRVARGLLRKADSAKPATPPAPAVVSDTSVLMASKAQPEIAKAPQPTETIPTMPAAFKQSAFAAAAATAETRVAASAALPAVKSDRDQLAPGSRSAGVSHDPNNSGASPNTSASPAAHMAKEYPWQPVSKPATDPMAIALQRAAEAAGKSESKSSAPSPLSTSFDNAGNAGNKISSGGAASATAPAKDAKNPNISSMSSVKPAASPKFASQEKPSSTATRTAPVASTSSSALGMPAKIHSVGSPSIFAVENEAFEAEGSSKKRVLIIAAILVLGAAAYFGWPKLHPDTPSSEQQQQAIPSQAGATVSAASSPATPVTPSPTSNQASSSGDNSSSDAELETSSKPSSITVAAAPEKIVVTKVRKPIVVKSNDSAVEASVQPLSPTELGVASNDKAVAKIVNVSTVAVPRVAASSDTLKISQGVSQGLLLKRVQPNYPQQALHMRIQGAVQLLASVGKTGDITSVKAISGDPLLSRAALDAVKQWKYKPYYLNGEPVAIQTQITMNFKLP
ncbi:MAG: hypothetical protein NVS9B5_19470 [Terriglobales bacterium]